MSHGWLLDSDVHPDILMVESQVENGDLCGDFPCCGNHKVFRLPPTSARTAVATHSYSPDTEREDILKQTLEEDEEKLTILSGTTGPSTTCLRVAPAKVALDVALQLGEAIVELVEVEEHEGVLLVVELEEEVVGALGLGKRRPIGGEDKRRRESGAYGSRAEDDGRRRRQMLEMVWTWSGLHCWSQVGGGDQIGRSGGENGGDDLGDDLSGFEGNFVVVFLIDLWVIVSGFEDKICEN
ncbi:hypothetical protein V8G54_019997 [Vigna mungo]|uniref:Uncharacterized protein n=1 Tax=Vigna mungo TaxID=3915 RepID=A0AAQ3NCU4_VIGMU